MIRSTLFLLALILTSQVQAQTPTELQRDIDKTVWKHFKQAFESSDGKALNDTYADDVLRVTPAGIDTAGVFKTDNLKSFEQSRGANSKISLDFWFDSRHTNATTSYEVGFFRITFTDGDGNANHNYGQFHIVLKKINGQWKITQDWDTTMLNGKEITAEDFARKSPAEF
ncbi:DUF4440 domain-containing protein [Alteromonadaceae bacterium M269]|nr:DUF4440 domain-containing protein [Alteromonadaceae bacterium M269]